jgi:hypothetical protein
VEVLDRLIARPALLDALCDVLGTDQLSYINGHLFVRAGPTDRRHPDHPWEGFHIDHDTGSFLPPFAKPGRFDYANLAVYFHDVDEDCAPTALVPGSHRILPGIMPRLRREGLLKGPNTFTDIRAIPEFSERASATAKRGSIGLCSSYLVHAAIPFTDKTQQRSLWGVNVARAADAAYNRYANAFAYGERDFTIPFWSQTSARVRSLFGWPEAGHPYYTPHTLELLAQQYPQMNLTPYRTAMSRVANAG